MNNQGKVILAGAGAGDPELITLKTLRYLQKADVILTDYLASNVIIDEFANPTAEIVYVGKQCKSGIKTPQASINDLLIHYAQQGLLVVRLKGGDVSIFSNIYDELITLKKHQINFEIIPGITSALGAAAYAGIPLTAREYANAVRFLTFYNTHTIETAQWKELAKTEDTLVFYMSSDKLITIAQLLCQYEADASKKIAVVEQATTPHQRVRVFEINELLNENLSIDIISPALIIVGKVVNLHNEFSWFHGQNYEVSYFKQGVAT